MGLECSVRQLELDSHTAIAKLVCKVAEGYLRDARNVASESKDIACVLVAGMTHEESQKQVSEEILQELEICVVAYFSFHWRNATAVIDKVHPQIFCKPYVNSVVYDGFLCNALNCMMDKVDDTKIVRDLILMLGYLVY